MFRFGIPEGCSGSACNYYVGLNVNEDDPEYLDVYLDGVADGWVAVGFSINTQMVGSHTQYMYCMSNG